ncbi:hypothetical protein N7523_006877 [Penicillium sp. IBT 18751x]|nr:hypothetical protein N7523_006877 [Penicillium sp. IBT 18751x]
MATQGTPSILFTNTQPQQGFRLLEIPPELEDLLTSKDAPALELKSPSAALAHAVADASGQEYVNLCTPTQTYRIRQVMSSNSLHIVRPSEGQISKADIKIVEDEVGDSGALKLPDEAVTAIAKCGSTLELHIPPGGFSAIPFLEKSLGLYDRRLGDDDGDIAMDESEALGPDGIQQLRDQVCADIPVSAAQCETGWVEICAFVDDRMKICWRPSSKMKVEVWKRMMEGALLQGIDLEKQFLVADLWKAVLDDDESEPFPRGLLEGVVRRLCVPDERPVLADEIKWASFDKMEVTKWIGETYLASIAPTASSAVGRSEFLRSWKDCLPEAWRGEATLSKLPDGCYRSPDPTTLFYVEPLQRQHVSKSSTAASSTAAKAKTTRNWHELLKNSSRR